MFAGIMDDVGDILFGDVVDTPKEGIEQHKKREELKSVMDKGKAHLLGHKSTHGRVARASDETIKMYAAYRQRELNEKLKKLQKCWASMPLICIPEGFLGLLKSGMLKNCNRRLRMIRPSKIRWPP